MRLAIIKKTGILLLYRSRDLSGCAAAIIEKQQRLGSSFSPRIIRVGGSKVADGFDIATFHERTGFSVINVGLYVQLGLNYLLAEIKPFIESGDVIVISRPVSKKHSVLSVVECSADNLWESSGSPYVSTTNAFR